jgi:hypothetical protein
MFLHRYKYCTVHVDFYIPLMSGLTFSEAGRLQNQYYGVGSEQYRRKAAMAHDVTELTGYSLTFCGYGSIRV